MKKISIPSKFKLSEEDEILNSNFKKVKLYIQSDGVNYNGSSFTIDAMEEAMKTIDYIPILGYIKNVNDEYDFDGHNISYDFHVDSNGNITMTENYEEIPIGVVTSKNSHIENIDGKNFLCAYGYIWKCYSNKGIEILERDIEKEVSMEIIVNDGDFDNDGIYAISNYEIIGVTVLGADVPAAIEGSKIQMSFSSNNKEYLDNLAQIKEMLANFNRKEGNEMEEFEKEVCEKCGKEPCECEKEKEFAEEEKCPKCNKPLDECKCEEDKEEDFAQDEEEKEEDKCPECGKPKDKCKCDEEEEKKFTQAEMDEAIANTRAEFSEVLVELAELREFKRECERKEELNKLNNSMDEILVNFNVDEEKVNELRGKVLEGEYSLDRFELELYRNTKPVKKDFSKKEEKNTLPIADTDEKISEVDALFAKYGVVKRNNK